MPLAITLGTNTFTEDVAYEGGGASTEDFKITGTSPVLNDVLYQGGAPVELEADEAKINNFLQNVGNVTGLSYGALIVTGDKNHINDFHVGNQPTTVPAVQIGGNRNIITGMRTEIGQRTQVVITGDYNNFTASIVEAGNQADDTYDGVQVDGDYNVVDDVLITSNNTGGSNHPRYGVNVTAGATENYIGVVHAPTAVTGVIVDNGTDTILLVTGTGSPGGGTVSHDDLTDQTPEHDLYAMFSQTGTVTTATGTHRLYIRHAFDIIDVEATVGNAPSGGSVVVDVNINGTSIYSTGHPTITTGTNTSGAAAPDGTSTGTTGQYVTVDVDSTTAPASDLTVIVRYRRT